MKYFKVEGSKDKRNIAANDERQLLIIREWSTFILRRRIVNCVLCLLSSITVFILVMVALVATGQVEINGVVLGVNTTESNTLKGALGQVGMKGVVIGVLLTRTLGLLGKLLNNVVSSLRSKE